MDKMDNFLKGRNLIEEWCQSNRLRYSIDDQGNLIFTFTGRDGNTRYQFTIGTQETDDTFAEYFDYYSFDLYTLDEHDRCEKFLESPSASTMGNLMKMMSFIIEHNTDYKDFPSYVDSTDEDYGEWIEKWNEKWKYYCSKCGSGTDRNGRFCDYCGTPMRNSPRNKPY